MKRTPELETCLEPKYGYYRAKFKYVELIARWVELVQNAIAKYGTVEEDIYKFNEADFQMRFNSIGIIVTAPNDAIKMIIELSRFVVPTMPVRDLIFAGNDMR